MWTTNQKRVMDVLLDDPLFFRLLLKEMVNVPFFFEDPDASASVGIFAWLADPYLVACSHPTQDLL